MRQRSSGGRAASVLVPIAAALSFWIGPNGASAQPAPGEAPAEAASAPGAQAPGAAPPGAEETPEALFERANAAYKAGQLAQAEALYRKAYGAKPSFDIGANLARVLLDQKRFAEGAELLARVLDELPPSVSDSARARIEEALAEAAAASLELKIQVNVDGALVRVDGREVGRSPLAHRVFAEPGEHTVEASGEGYDASTRKVSGQAGASADAVLALTRRVGGPKEPAGDEGLPASPIVVGGVLSAVMFVLGGVMLEVSAGQVSDADAHRDALSAQLRSPDVLCPDAPDCAELDADYETARTSADASTGLFVAGGVAAAATIAYLIVWAGSGGSEDAAEGAAAARVSPMPMIGPTEAGIGISARF